MSMRAIQISRLGGPEVLTPVELPEPTPKPHQLLVNVAAAGINYADTHIAEGSYLSKPELPLVPGSEVIGRTPDGRRVMALTDGSGGYAEKAAVVGQLAVEVPETVSDGEALAVLAQGLSAWHLLRTCARLAPGETVVINAAAGGVGSLAVQLAKIFGAGRVIATASTVDKQKLAVDLGADAAVDGSPDGYAERVIEANGGRRVDVVLEPVGGAVFDAALRTAAGRTAHPRHHRSTAPHRRRGVPAGPSPPGPRGHARPAYHRQAHPPPLTPGVPRMLDTVLYSTSATAFGGRDGRVA